MRLIDAKVRSRCACHSAFALERAREWTTTLSEWCEAQPQLAAFRGTCMVDRAEILRISGDWSQAMEQAGVNSARELIGTLSE